MKLMRLAMCVAVFALVGGIAVSGDMDIQSLQAKLAAQEARLNDLQSKMAYSRGGGDSESVVSLRKNATVTIGGTVNTRYFYRDGEVKSSLNVANNPAAATPHVDRYQVTGVNSGRSKVADMKHGDLRISDAKVEMKIDVNEYFDAYLKMDLHDGAGRSSVSGVAQNYWVRWKNVCNSGFGLLVGRDALKFGDSQPIGLLDSWNKDAGGSVADLTGQTDFAKLANRGEGMFAYGSMNPSTSNWNWTRTTQITPYWESQDGKIKAEVSFIQSIDRINGMTNTRSTVDSSGTTKYRSVNYGVGSMTARLTWKPIEGLKLVASAMNLHANQPEDFAFGPEGRRTNSSSAYGLKSSKNNSAVNFGFQYRPCFFDRLNVWTQWTHGWNEAWVDNQDSDTINYGASFDITDQLTFFAMGDFMRVKNDRAEIWRKATGWAVYTGLKYKLPYGVNMEAGWRHEQIRYKGKGGTAYSGTHTKFKGDTIYAHLGFDF